MVTIKTNFNVNFNPETVMSFINCSKDSPVYDEMLAEFSDLAKDYINKIKPIALMEFGKIPKEISNKDIKEGSKALFCIVSVGNELSEASTQAFKKGDCVAGLLLDAMADDALFQADAQIKEDVIQICKDKNLGIKKRLEAPNDIAMESQKTVWEITDAFNHAGIHIKESLMFDPVKTLCEIYIVDAFCEEYNTDHDCTNCTLYNCPLRNIPPKKITVLLEDTNKEILVKENQSIMEAMFMNDIYVPAICGGRGSCGKCGIYVIQGDVPISKEDRNFFTNEQLENGKRLSCKAYPKTDCIISLKISEDNFEILTNYDNKQIKKDTNFKKNDNVHKVIVDIGTTTIAMQRIDSITGEIFDTFTTINKQRTYGADVITRMQASNEGQLEKLKEIIRKQLSLGLKGIIEKSDNKISEIIVAGNTTMVHLFMGYSCEKLGVFPYEAYNLYTIKTTFDGLPLTILPGISTFVGADITAGILACNMDIESKISILIDLGTNGEMVIGNKDKLYVTSTAAGPAFEGGNISCGIGSINGAICNVKMENKEISLITTIGGTPPIGICGTGVLEIVSELLKEGLIDDTGLLEDEYFDTGFLIATLQNENNIYLSQKDIREIQLAKSAVRAGLETLLLRYEVTYKDIDKLYLAGGFGYQMDIKKAISIGLFPKELKDKIIPIGNSSLNGCNQYATKENQKERAKKICDYAQEIPLSNDKDFNKLYTEYMFF